ncbi:hypothetical protein MRX96_026240 [Rhipicephalus microplus]
MDLRRKWCNARLPKLNPQLPFALILNKTNPDDSSLTSTSWEPGWSDVNIPDLDQRATVYSDYAKEIDTSGKGVSESPDNAFDNVSCQRFVAALVVVGVTLVATTVILATLDAPFKSDHAVSKQVGKNLAASPIRDRLQFPHSMRGDFISANSNVNAMTDGLTGEVATPLTVDEIDEDSTTRTQDDQSAGEDNDIPSLVTTTEETFRVVASLMKATFQHRNSTSTIAV